MSECVFCKIVNNEIPSKRIYEDDKVIAFNDINPQAPVHFLVVPKKHIESFSTLSDNDTDLLKDISIVIKKLVKDFNIDKSGYRIVINTGKQGGQSVPHLHFHILGGRDLEWPPG